MDLEVYHELSRHISNPAPKNRRGGVVGNLLPIRRILSDSAKFPLEPDAAFVVRTIESPTLCRPKRRATLWRRVMVIVIEISGCVVCPPTHCIHEARRI
jgi:hypothetical protein